MSTDAVWQVLDEYGEASIKLKSCGRRIATSLAENDQALPAGLIRGNQPEESYRILYLDDGSGGACPSETQLIRLCGERATEDADNYELFFRIVFATL